MSETIKLVRRLRDAADADDAASAEIDPAHYTPDDPNDIAAGLEFRARERRECADLLEQQAARIAELEAAIRKQANAARSLADATIRDASIRQGLAEKAYAESSPEVLASERQANALLTEENERLTARLTALESERDALLAAAGKKAVAEPVAWFTDDSQSDRSATTWDRNVADRWRAKGWPVHPLYTAPTAAPEKGVGRDAWQPIETAPKDKEIWAFNGEQGRMLWSEGNQWGLWVWADELLSDVDPEPNQPTHWQPLPAPPAALYQKANDGLSLRAQHEDACIAANNNAQDAERYRWLRTLDSDFGNRNRMSEMARFYGETLDEAIDAALSQKANDSLSLRAQHEDACIEANKNAQDAERYRHLRQCNSGSLVIVQIIGTGDDEQIVLTEEDADAAIDVALSQKAGEQQ